MQTRSKFVSEEYPLLHHYTDAFGLKGIIENNELWATHFHYLNDFKELVASRDRLLPHVIKAAKKAFVWWNEKPEMADVLAKAGGYDKVVEHEATSIVDAVLKATINITPPYLVSFASPDNADERDSGSLDLWRAYSKDAAGGYCIVFDTKRLEALTEEEATKHHFHLLHMADVNYDKVGTSDTEKLSSQVVAVLNGLIERMEWDVRGSKLDPEELYEPSAIELTRHKSAHFRNEREVRLVVSPITKKSMPSLETITSREVFHRAAGGCLVPTMRVFGMDVSPLPITRIIVGPSDRQEQREDGAQSFVKSLGREIEVVSSQISYRAM